MLLLCRFQIQSLVSVHDVRERHPLPQIRLRIDRRI